MAHYRFHAPGGDYGHRDLLGQVFFAFDGATIGAEDKELLRGIAAELNAHPERTVTLIGYSDWQGQEKYNLRLSQKRADVVAEFLRSEGVAPDHIHTDARGAQDSPEGLAKNQARFDRRVDILSH
jgi:OOP family OmpA-OmpF porin